MARGRQATMKADAEERESGGEAREGREAREGATADAQVSGTGGAGGAGGAPGQPLIDLDFVRGLIDAVDRSGIDSLEVTRAGTRVKISKTPPAAAAPPYYAAPPAPAASAPAAAPSPPEPSAGGAEGAAKAAAAESGLTEVKSPMVGTFYRAPAPEAPPYVEVGSRVTKGQTLCIIEAMKLMNELESEVEGVVRAILVDNAEPVEYGQVLFRIDPSG